MTLSTSIRIIEPHPVQEIFDVCNALLGAVSPKTSHEDCPYDPGLRQIMNEPGQGYDAWLIVEYGADSPIPAVDGAPECAIDVDFDTSYSYQNDNGGGCADLHAWFIRELGRGLDARGLTWYWQNEFTGEWHPSSDPVTSLGNPEKGALFQEGVRV